MPYNVFASIILFLISLPGLSDAIPEHPFIPTGSYNSQIAVAQVQTTTLGMATASPNAMTPVPTDQAPITAASSQGFPDWLIEFLKVVLPWQTALVGVLCSWPVVVLAVLLLFHNVLPQILKEISPRISRVSFLQLTVEFAVVPPPPAILSEPFITELRGPNQYINSGIQMLLTTLKGTPMDYMPIDLGEGHEWLTSRLFIFALVLQRAEKLKSFVFLHTRDGVQGRFLGVASPEDIWQALAFRYPYLETAYANAVSASSKGKTSFIDPPSSGKLVVDLLPSEMHAVADALPEVAQLFLREIQRPVPSPRTDVDGWVTLSGSEEKEERARWIDRTVLEQQIARGILQTDEYFLIKEFRDMPDSTQVRKVLRSTSQFVALLDERFVFKKLIDRQALAEQVVTRLAKPPDE